MAQEKYTLHKQDLAARMPGIAERYFGRRAVAVKHLGGGSFGMAFRLDFADGGRAVVKAYRVEGMNETEAFQLRLLAAHTPVPMPEPLFTAENLLGMSFIEGRPAMVCLPLLLGSKRARRRFAMDVVDGMEGWHATQGEKFGLLREPRYDSWPAFYRTVVDEVITALPTLGIQERQKETLYRAAERFGDVVPDVDAPRLIHGDLNIMNIMADPKTLRLTGFIDPFHSMWADRDYDIFQLLWFNGRFGLYDAYKARAGLDGRPMLDLKTAYYAAFNEALAFLRSGTKFEPNHILCDQRLRREMKRAGMQIQ